MTGALQPYRGSYLMPAFERATVVDVMRPGVMSCAPDSPLVSVAQTMATHHVHSVVVGGMTKHQVLAAGIVLNEHATAHLLVVSGGHPSGVVSSLDIAAALAWGRG